MPRLYQSKDGGWFVETVLDPFNKHVRPATDEEVAIHLGENHAEPDPEPKSNGNGKKNGNGGNGSTEASAGK